MIRLLPALLVLFGSCHHTTTSSGVLNDSDIIYASSLSKVNDGYLDLEPTWNKNEVLGVENWYISPPLLPISVAASDHIRDPLCRNQSRLFLQQLKNFTLWAVQMFDAAAKLPTGMLSGNTFQMGHYDECLEISVDTGANHGGALKGQYCLAEITVDSPVPVIADPYTMNYDPMISAWNKIKYQNDPAKVRRDVLHWALCVPASCKPEEIHNALSHELTKIGENHGVYFNARVTSDLCHTLVPPQPFSTGDIIYLSVLGSKLPSKVEKILLCFSARRNLEKLLNESPVQPAIDASHGPRFLFMLFIIMGHRVTTFGGHPLYNAESEEWKVINLISCLSNFMLHYHNFLILHILFRDLTSMLLANGPLIVDGFFALSGVLLAYPLLMHLTKTGGLNLAMPILVRFVRLTPSYMMLVFFFATLMPHMGSGPFWDKVVGHEQRRCATNWWTNLLYINNYVNVGDMCMFQSWYVAADFHLYIISLFVVYCVWRWPRLGYSFLATFMALSIIIPFSIIYELKAPPLFYPYPQNIVDVRDTWYFQNIYVATHNRASPYFVGVIIGVILYNLRNCTFKLGKVTSHIAYACLWTFGIGIMISAYIFFIPGRPYNALEAALYGSLHRVGFAAAIAAFFVVLTCGNVDVHQRFLSWKPLVVLSRLTYGAYLAHTMGQMYDQGSLRVPRYLSAYTGLWLTLADLTSAFSISLLLLLLIEAPFRGLEKIVFGKT
ncbi:hypothetical protein C0J52_19812 [Blattella germanica]|nr:hypothetical protein C0J52_19812 [Blattella germanica]